MYICEYICISDTRNAFCGRVKCPKNTTLIGSGQMVTYAVLSLSIALIRLRFRVY